MRDPEVTGIVLQTIPQRLLLDNPEYKREKERQKGRGLNPGKLEGERARVTRAFKYAVLFPLGARLAV